MRTTSNRELARQIGVSETAVRRAEKSDRIRREADGSWDLARVQAAWSGNTDRLEVWRGGKVLSVLWADSGSFKVNSFVRGSWEDEALVL